VGVALRDKVAIVTGSGRGIGQAEAVALAAEGASVVVNDIDRARADGTVAQIRAAGGAAVANADSVADFAAAGRIIQTALDAFGRLDVLVNNAGRVYEGLFHEMSEADWDGMIEVHLKGAFNTCRHAVPIMRAQRSGAIVNTTSSQWRNPEGRAAYGAAKAGVVSLTYDLAWELRQFGVTVNAIAPLAATQAYVDSIPYEKRMVAEGLLRGKAEDEADRPGPVFVPPLIVYLAAGEAPQVTGVVFRVGAGKIGLYSHPSEIRSIYRDRKNGPWTLDQLRAVLPSTLLQGDPKAAHIPSA
jgi:NAD(P)-dependent dehydrogenase (short-subunit alcohol dehydrogenase family)